VIFDTSFHFEIFYSSVERRINNMTAAVILTNPIIDDMSDPIKKANVVHLISEIKPYFHEIILISDCHSFYLPHVKEEVRILKPYHKGNERLAALHTSLSLAASEDVWLLHESKKFPGIQLFKQLKTLKNRTNSQSVLFEQKNHNPLLYSLFDKSVLKFLDKLLASNKDHIDYFMNQINYISFSSNKN
jgi:hypothetical protein